MVDRSGEHKRVAGAQVSGARAHGCCTSGAIASLWAHTRVQLQAVGVVAIAVGANARVADAPEGAGL